MREWIGARHVHDLKSHSFLTKNPEFESTIKVKAMFAEMGRRARKHPEQMIFDLLSSGFETKSFDSNTYFSETHTMIDAKEKKVEVSNMQDGTAPHGSCSTHRG